MILTRKLLKQLRASFFQWLSTGLFVLLLTSCGSFTHTSYRVESVLAVTSKGDTIQMPLSQIRRQYDYNTYSNWQFYYGNNWWFWNTWPYRYSTPYYNWNRFTYVPRRPATRPQTQPQRRPQRARVATPRGSRPNYTPRTPQRIQRNTTPTRTRTTPNVQTRTNVGRRSNGVRQKQ